MSVEILIVAVDPFVAHRLWRRLDRLGYVVVGTVASRDEAMRAAAGRQPDLVLLDIGEAASDDYVDLGEVIAKPVIVLTTRSQAMTMASAKPYHYLQKPFSAPELQSAVELALHQHQILRQLYQQNRMLRELREETEEAHRIAYDLLTRMTAHGLASDVAVSWIRPAARFSGDMVAATRSPSGNTYLLLADATGHGLAAAVSLMPVMDVFFGMARRAFTVSSMVGEMNRKLRQMLPRDRFVAATLASINYYNDTIEVWNGGNPPGLLVSSHGHTLYAFSSRHLALGILDNDEFDGSTEVYRCSHPTRLVLYSDGVAEACDGNGQAFGAEGVQRALRASTAEDTLNQLRVNLLAHLGEGAPLDDFSAIAADYRHHRPKVAAVQAPSQPAGNDAWQMSVSLSATQLRLPNLAQTVMNCVQLSGLRPTLVATLSLVIGELLTNALEHGILDLDSAIKRDVQGFEAYFAERQRRLDDLTHGHIDVSMKGTVDHVELRITDSGPGFAFDYHFNPEFTDTHAHGRGIALVSSVCKKLEYRGLGNEVWAEIAADD